MPDIDTLKQQASQLRKAGKYSEALPIFQTLWEQHRADCSEWEGWGYAFCLRKLERSREALPICHAVYQTKADFDHNRSLYAWCVYDTEIAHKDAGDDVDEARLIRAADAILKLTQPGTYSPYARTVLAVMSYFGKKPNPPAARVLEWSSKITPEQLSDVPGTGVDPDTGKPRAFASDREKWYAARSKALLDLSRFQECMTLSQEALQSFQVLHHDNDIWFRWRIALCRASMGDKDQALAELKALLSRKKDWFIQHRIAQLLFELGRNDEAFPYAVDAALNFGDLEYKWDLFLLMGQILQAQSKLDEAKKHVLLAAKLREEHQWKATQALSSTMQTLGLDMIEQKTANQLNAELQPYWKSIKLSSLPRVSGKVAKLLPSGKDGIIDGDDQKGYYFKLNSFRGKRDKMVVGLRVSFSVEKNPDPAKRDFAVFIEEAKA